LTELIEASNPNGFETVNLCSVYIAELCLLIVIAEIDCEKFASLSTPDAGATFQKNSTCADEPAAAGEWGVGNTEWGKEITSPLLHFPLPAPTPHSLSAPF
jgi:hypothetical protein